MFSLDRSSLVLAVCRAIVVCPLVRRSQRHFDGPQEVAEARREAAGACAEQRHLRSDTNEFAAPQSVCEEIEGALRSFVGLVFYFHCAAYIEKLCLNVRGLAEGHGNIAPVRHSLEEYERQFRVKETLNQNDPEPY